VIPITPRISSALPAACLSTALLRCWQVVVAFAGSAWLGSPHADLSRDMGVKKWQEARLVAIPWPAVLSRRHRRRFAMVSASLVSTWRHTVASAPAQLARRLQAALHNTQIPCLPLLDSTWASRSWHGAIELELSLPEPLGVLLSRVSQSIEATNPLVRAKAQHKAHANPRCNFRPSFQRLR